MAEPSNPFESLPLPRRDVPGTGLNRYRVYTDYEHFTVVEAESVIDALRASGVRQAYRVLRDNLGLHNVLDIRMLGGDFAEPPVVAPVTEPKPEPKPVAIPVQAAEPVQEVQEVQETKEEVFITPPPPDALSSEDINNLLKS